MIRWCESREELEKCIERIKPMARAVENYITAHQTITGWCGVCQKISTFRVMPPEVGSWSDLRESIMCGTLESCCMPRYNPARMKWRLTSTKSAPSTRILGPSWIDAPDAQAQALVRAKGLHPEILQRGLEMIRDGFTVIPDAVDESICKAAMNDFARYVRRHEAYSSGHKDQTGRHYRFVNFHLESEAAMAIGMNERVLQVLDFLFGRKAAVYTSLYFEYGTGQPIHRDSPFFHTFPINYFVGVWTALEDIHPDSGPLTYVPGGHRWEIDHQAIFRRVCEENPTQTHEWCVNQALEVYYGVVIKRATESGTALSLPLRRGDTAIWHAQTPHGGAPIANKALTRTSIVFHCVPEDMQVYQQGVFFSHPPTNQPEPRFGYISRKNRKYANAGGSAFAESY